MFEEKAIEAGAGVGQAPNPHRAEAEIIKSAIISICVLIIWFNYA